MTGPTVRTAKSSQNSVCPYNCQNRCQSTFPYPDPFEARTERFRPLSEQVLLTPRLCGVGSRELAGVTSVGSLDLQLTVLCR